MPHAYKDPEKPWLRLRTPHEKMEEWETESGVSVKVGETVTALPTYLRERLPAVVESIYWDPLGLPGGEYDHRGEKVGEDDDGHPVFENPDKYECILTVLIRFDVPDDHEYSHMNGKQRKVEGYNIDYVIGGISQFD